MNEIQRFNKNGSENLDWWFGGNGTSNNNSNETSKSIFTAKPRYVRYTLVSLRKRSTERLNKMHYNVFGKVDSREVMINNLCQKLNRMWDLYSPNNLEYGIDQFGISYIEGIQIKSRPNPKGRPMVFQTEQQVSILYTEYLEGLTLKQLSAKYGVNIATLSQTFNGKGKYATWLFGDESECVQ